MPRKKIEVVELNKKREKILLAEEQPSLILFWRRHNVLIFLTMLILSLTIVGISIMVTIKSMDVNVEPRIKDANTSIDVSIGDYNIGVGDSLTAETAENMFLNNGTFAKNGEVLLVKTVEHSAFTIKYYSDGTAFKMMKNKGSVTRINPLDNGDYGIKSDGTISSNAKIIDVVMIKKEEYAWGVIKYYSDGSAEISNSKIDMFVRNANDIHEKYISDNKVTYLKESKNVGNVKLDYYYDGTVQVVKNNKSYLVRTVDDLNISGSDVTFKNGNAAAIYKTSKLDDGIIIDYYDDGGAIIRDGSKTISVRKSNSIVIKNNKIYEIVDNKYVEISKKNGSVTYYTNGGAVVENYNGKTVYVSENGDIKYNGNFIASVGDNAEELINETTNGNENVKVFEKTAVVTTDEYIAIVPKDKVAYDAEGKVKEIGDVEVTDGMTDFTITNNSNERINYLVAIKKSNNTSVNVEYLRFQISNNNKHIGTAKLNDAYWEVDNLYKAFDVNGDNYILLKDTLAPYMSDSVRLMLWADYDTIPNSEQDKYFYGTIKVYAWTEE